VEEEVVAAGAEEVEVVAAEVVEVEVEVEVEEVVVEHPQKKEKHYGL
jgi:hypothetical protein